MMFLWLSPDPHLELIHVFSSSEPGSLLLTVQSKRPSASCPKCKKITSRIHSRYARITDHTGTPCQRQPVELQLLSRKWFYDKSECSVMIFTERYEGIPANGRRTFRAEDLLRKIVFSTSWLAAEKVAHAAHIPLSHDALLVIVHRAEIIRRCHPFLGLDDFAFKKGHTYGTMICDLQTHKPLCTPARSSAGNRYSMARNESVCSSGQPGRLHRLSPRDYRSWSIYQANLWSVSFY